MRADVQVIVFCGLWKHSLENVRQCDLTRLSLFLSPRCVRSITRGNRSASCLWSLSSALCLLSVCVFNQSVMCLCIFTGVSVPARICDATFYANRDCATSVAGESFSIFKHRPIFKQTIWLMVAFTSSASDAHTL